MSDKLHHALVEVAAQSSHRPKDRLGVFDLAIEKDVEDLFGNGAHEDLPVLELRSYGREE